MKITCLKWMAWTAVVVTLNLLPTAQTGAGPSNKKVAVCHKGQTLELPEAAVQAHLNHGDTLGPCNVTPNQNR